ncbi:MAG: HAMP domain-containing histidine kinase [Chloroflexales bacterium]|nr:HAMP domain-containing histidine kinase [Chloroflexales bacterium]
MIWLSQALQPLSAALQELTRRSISSRRLGRLANTPPVAWSLRTITRIAVRPSLQQTSAQLTPCERTTRGDLQSTLQDIVDDVIDALGYSVAMVALYEQGDSLDIHAIQFDSSVLTREKIQSWERQLSELIGTPVSLDDPRVARTFVFQDEYADNLSVKAARSQRPVISNALFDLFTPITPAFTRPIVDGIQQELGISQVIAVPFFLETTLNGKPAREMVGNLFAARREPITESALATLSAFGRQAAAAILSERQRIQIELSQELVLKIQTSLQDEGQLLQHIAEGVVSYMGYMFALVATYEADGALPLRATCFDPAIIPIERIHEWERQVSRFMTADRPISLIDPEVARIYVNRPEYQDNLGVQAVQTGSNVVSDTLYNIFTPVVPAVAKPLIDAIQAELGIRQVITVPFFLERLVDGELRRELVGNLFTVTRSRSFRAGEIELLQTFGQQAAAGLSNARLYRQSEGRRAAAQLFGRMAFTASASVHALKNHIGAVRLPLQLINMAIKSPQAFPDDERVQLLARLEKGSEVFRHLDEMADMLDTLHEPWRQKPDVLTDVNACLSKALNKIQPSRAEWIEVELAEDLLQIHTAPDMLTEAFKVLIKNAVEALEDIDRERRLRIASQLEGNATIRVTVSDNGVGIRAENRHRIFEMRWSTKPSGLGFGLFWTRDYIQGLGGQITVESEWGQGTSFQILLPTTHTQQAVLESSTTPIDVEGVEP